MTASTLTGNMMRIGGLAVLSLLFLASAIGKQLSMDAFEATLNFYGFGLVSSSVAARLIISLEAFLAVIIWIPRFRNPGLAVIFLLTAAFSAGLVWFQWAYPHAKDCGCHGQLLALDPVQALAKNALILLIAGLLWWRSTPQSAYRRRWMTWVMVLAGLITLAGPPILSPPDFLLIDKQELSEPVPFPNPDFVRSLPVYGPQKRYILLFVSPTCKFCQYMTARVYGLVETGQITLPVYFVVLAENEAEVSQLWQQTQVTPFPYTALSDYDKFIAMSGQHLPSMFLMEGTDYRAHFAYRTMSLELIREFQGD